MSPKKGTKMGSKQAARPTNVTRTLEMHLDFQLPDIPVAATAASSQQQEQDLKPTLQDIQSVLPSLLEKRSKKTKTRFRRKPAATQPQPQPGHSCQNSIGAASRFATNAWVEGVVKSLQNRAQGFDEIKNTYDTVERDMFEVSNRWDRLISSLRNPFEESTKYVPNDDDNGFSDEKLGPDDLLEPVLSTDAGAALSGLNWLGMDWM